MKIGIIDVGSNSVRLAVMADGKTLYKRLSTTRLGEGLSFSCALNGAAIERTAAAVSHFKSQAETDGAEKTLVFATAAVRSATNGGAFVDRVKELCGLTVDVISGEEEAGIGLLGALKGRDGGIIDVGGASTEVTFQSLNKLLYTKSVNVGTVRLYDLAGRDRNRLEEVIAEKISAYPPFDGSVENVFAIGGTASRLGAVKNNLTEYKSDVIDGTTLTQAEMEALSDRLLKASVEEIRATTICQASADVVGGGCLLMYRIMKKFGVGKITVSESDNIEGYYYSRVFKVK